MPPALTTKKHLPAIICLALAVVTVAVYLPSLRDGFINFDDDAYITANPHVTGGLSWAGIVWALKSGYASNWHPLTWISHMADCQLFGLNPAGHHLVNVLFHAANTVLLFILLNMMTGVQWRSAFVAALFALHPLHVESVAWAAERKDVLSGFFWMLTFIAYAKYAARPRITPLSTFGFACSGFYWLALLFFACGLMSKPTVVTLPFVLLLLDYWPLYRFKISALRAILVEKIPFLILSFAGCVVTYAVQKDGGAVTDNSLSFRISNALWAYERYIAKVFWPANLSIAYPFQTQGLLVGAIIAALVLAACTIAFIYLSGRQRYFFTGWFWFIGTLVPTIGIVQVGSASMADRYSYLPSIGLFILVTWCFADYFASRHEKTIPIAMATVVLAACAVATSIQITYWRNSITLFSHALKVTTNNYIACACLGNALDAIGQEEDAYKLCSAAVQLEPDYPAGQYFLGTVLWKMGETNQSANHIEAAAQDAPHDPEFQYNLGKFLMEHNVADKAAERFQAALDDNPDFAEAHNALGKTFWKLNDLQKATNELSQASALQPNNPDFHYDSGTVLLADSQPDQAIEEFSQAIALKPDFVSAEQNLAVALADQGKLNEAITHFSRVAQLQPNNPDAYFNLGFAYLNNHQPADAASQFSKELEMTPNETKAHYRLAQALEQQNQLPKAVSEYRRILQLTPHFPEAQKALDEILAAHPELR